MNAQKTQHILISRPHEHPKLGEESLVQHRILSIGSPASLTSFAAINQGRMKVTTQSAVEKPGSKQTPSFWCCVYHS